MCWNIRVPLLYTGYYLKFFHNVMMNSFATIYFHNYLRLDEMPVNVTSPVRISGLKSPDINSDTEINSECSENPSTTKDPLDFKSNFVKHEMMNSVVTINIDGKENQKRKSYAFNLSIIVYLCFIYVC